MFRKALIVAAAGIMAQPLFAQDRAMVDETRKVALQLVARLGGELQEKMKEGPAAAVGVCKTIAPAAASELSRSTGWRITRVSLKVRNPLLGTPDDWEATALADFDRRAAAGEDPASFEKSEVVKQGERQYLRYIKALPVQPMCLNCHGSDAMIAPEVKARLKAEYPHDQATGYAPGQVRGGLSVKRPL
jgi:uncharacterized protein DUF3365